MIVMIRAGDVRVAYPLFQEEGSGSIPTSALQLRFDSCSMKRAQELNRAWHSVLPKTNYGNLTRNRRAVAYTAEFDGLLYAVAIWTDPVAANRLKHGDVRLELRRMAIATDAPPNTASRMISWMRKDVKARWPELVGLVSYQDTAAHQGTIYKASGWKMIDTSGSLTEWSVNGRVRNNEQSKAPKVRGSGGMTNWMEGDWPENCEAESNQDKLLKKAAGLIRKLCELLPAVNAEVDEIIGELNVIADDIESIFESNDPRSMGWVGDDGLP